MGGGGDGRSRETVKTVGFELVVAQHRAKAAVLMRGSESRGIGGVLEITLIRPAAAFSHWMGEGDCLSNVHPRRL